MEEVLSVYERPYNEQYPVVCLDESPKQLLEVIQYHMPDGTRLEDSDGVDFYLRLKIKNPVGLQSAHRFYLARALR